MEAGCNRWWASGMEGEGEACQTCVMQMCMGTRWDLGVRSSGKEPTLKSFEERVYGTYQWHQKDVWRDIFR